MLDKIKYVSFYLPQFHEISENNEWWGKGFTEWSNVKTAKPLFKEHYQPRVPKNNNYYDLSKINDIKAQFEKAKKNNIYGFCFYHYWFNGKLLLEKPAELLLDNKEIDGNYCFSWANETWARTWNGQDKNILIQQDYGNKQNWINHIHYLMKFFKDERYIKIDNQPVLLIYNSHKIENFDEMLNVWNNELLQNNMEKVCFIDTLNSFNHTQHKKASFGVHFEPWYTITTDYRLRTYLRIKKSIRNLFMRFIAYDKLPKFIQSTINYDYINKRIMSRNVNKSTFTGLFPDWDNSPRKATTGHSTIIDKSTPKKFAKYNKVLRKKILDDNLEKFIFINAWNEWGESAYLEEDEKYGSAYLDVIKNSEANDD